MSSSGEPVIVFRPNMNLGGERLAIRVSGGRVLVGIRTRPGATVTRPVGLYGDRLKVEVAAPAEDGRANKTLVRAMAGWVGVPADRVTVEVGRTGRDKVLAIAGIDEAVFRERLDGLLGESARGRVR